ncbi:class II glutamine amidotransferase [Magnetospira sp. QH-2]|uniref:class II glutamine amidotransferase n=1 Tax=Magnetospira sp. (strain QH-2) TaxID=1288970 RepID=UPI0003E8138C|nr:class II glutamine amidotransferase [Magnetospira sp. QH-2]CCQ73363.1 Putative glutamine amidotransferase, class-II [Magnetospira sp. QH-2]
MCELFAMSSSHPATVTLSLTELARHGGLTGPHKDGFGIAYYEEGDARVIRDVGAAYDSPWIRFVADTQLQSDLVISHIRKATHGDVTLRNTHPFRRELGGHLHIFAHNGDLLDLEKYFPLTGKRFRPIGESDSEHAFCLLLEALAPLWDTGVPSLEARLEVVTAFAARLRDLGSANFLYADGQVLFAHGHKRTQVEGQDPRPPGLQVLCRHCTRQRGQDDKAVDGVTIGGGRQDVVLLASVPLSDESWRPLVGGEVLAVTKGRIAARRTVD